MSMSSQDLGQHQRNIFTVICLDLLCKVQVSDFKIEMTSTTWRKLYKQGSLTSVFGPKKTTRFGSNMEPRSKPFASEGLDGITTWCRNEQALSLHQAAVNGRSKPKTHWNQKWAAGPQKKAKQRKGASGKFKSQIRTSSDGNTHKSKHKLRGGGREKQPE